MHPRAFTVGLVLASALSMVPVARAQQSPGGELTVTSPAPGKVLTLEEAVALALRQQPTISAAQLSELNLKSAQGFYDVGTKPKSDVTLAEVQVANARVALIQARNQVDLAQTILVNAIGIRTTAPLEVEDILTYEPVSLDFQGLLKEALDIRPELRQARAQVEAVQAQLGGARAGYLPTVTAT